MNTKIKVALASIPLIASGLFVTGAANADTPAPTPTPGWSGYPVISRYENVQHRFHKGHQQYRLCYHREVLNDAGAVFDTRNCDLYWHNFHF